jgi:hypothetical protein
MSTLTNEDKSIPSGAEQADSLPVKKGEDFIGEFENMDLSNLQDKTFFVGVNSGDREKGQMLSTTIKGPYNFYEMIEEVGIMWKEHLHHAKVYFASKDRTEKNKFVDRNTVDYIEANWENILTDGLLAGIFDEEEYTCQAGVNEADPEGDPRFADDEEHEDA